MDQNELNDFIGTNCITIDQIDKEEHLEEICDGLKKARGANLGECTTKIVFVKRYLHNQSALIVCGHRAVINEHIIIKLLDQWQGELKSTVQQIKEILLIPLAIGAYFKHNFNQKNDDNFIRDHEYFMKGNI